MRWISIFGAFSLFALANAADNGTIEPQNYDLASQALLVDAAVVALTNETAPTDAQGILSDLQSLTSSVSAALAASSGTAATADPAVEFAIARSWGLLGNYVEELMADYIHQKGLISTQFGLGYSLHDQIVSFNTSFMNYAAFILTMVTDAPSQKRISGNTGGAYGDPKNFLNAKTGILWALYNFPAAPTSTSTSTPTPSPTPIPA